MPALIIGGYRIAIREQMRGQRRISAAVVSEAMNDDDFAARPDGFMAAQVQPQTITCRQGLFDKGHARLPVLLKLIRLSAARLIACIRNCNPRTAQTIRSFPNPLFQMF